MGKSRVYHDPTREKVVKKDITAGEEEAICFESLEIVERFFVITNTDADTRNLENLDLSLCFRPHILKTCCQITQERRECACACVYVMYVSDVDT